MKLKFAFSIAERFYKFVKIIKKRCFFRKVSARSVMVFMPKGIWKEVILIGKRKIQKKTYE